MRLLLDNNLSPRLIPLLEVAGWDIEHVNAWGLRAANDPTVLAAARADRRVLISADTDFGALLAASHEAGPSLVLVRRLVGRRAEVIAGVLRANLPVVADEIDAGAIVVLGEDTIRIRRLPI